MRSLANHGPPAPPSCPLQLTAWWPGLLLGPPAFVCGAQVLAVGGLWAGVSAGWGGVDTGLERGGHALWSTAPWWPVAVILSGGGAPTGQAAEARSPCEQERGRRGTQGSGPPPCPHLLLVTPVFRGAPRSLPGHTQPRAGSLGGHWPSEPWPRLHVVTYFGASLFGAGGLLGSRPRLGPLCRGTVKVPPRRKWARAPLRGGCLSGRGQVCSEAAARVPWGAGLALRLPEGI